MAGSASGKIWVTGASGFIGSRLVPYLTQEGYEVAGPHLDLLDASAIADTLRSREWDAVIHLAAVSHVPTSEKEPDKAYRTNVAGTGLLLELMQRHRPSAHLVFTSTAQVYRAPVGGDGAPAEHRLDENTLVQPQNTYARTKRAGEAMVECFAQAYGMRATVLRLFNHTHRSQSPDFFLPYLYSVLSAAPKEAPVDIPIGNLAVARDFGTIQDLMRAFSSVLKARLSPQLAASTMSSSAVEFLNVCSGTPKNLGVLARGLAERLGVDARFRTDPARVRPNEPLSIVGSHDRLTRLTGWKPECSSEGALLDAFLSG